MLDGEPAARLDSAERVGGNGRLPIRVGGRICSALWRPCANALAPPRGGKDYQIRNVEVYRARGQDEADVVGVHLQAATSPLALMATGPPVTGGMCSPR